MHYTLTAVLSAVIDNAVAVLKSADLCNLWDLLKDTCNICTVLLSDGIGTTDVLLRYDKHVNGCLRRNIVESEDVLILVYLLRGNLPCNYFAKQTKIS